MLIKLIDAEKDLSIQVHPDNDYALAREGEYGKTEMWYVADAKPGASLLYGFEQEISRQELAQRMRDNTLLEVLHRQPVKAGDLLFIPAGTIPRHLRRGAHCRNSAKQQHHLPGV